ncbi:MAG TPA: hypothetical protein VF181_10690 [Balneolaceae bacterium]
MKSLVHKLLAFTFVIALFSGCAAVTSADLVQPQEQKAELVMPPQPDNPGMSSDQDMSPIVDEPTWETNM